MKTLIFTGLDGSVKGKYSVNLITEDAKRFTVFQIGDGLVNDWTDPDLTAPASKKTAFQNGLFFDLLDYSVYDFIQRARELNYVLTAYEQGSNGVGKTPVVLSAGTTIPIMSAGPDQPAVAAATATLAGTCSNYADNLVTYLWTKVSGPAGGAITNPALKNSGLTGLVVGTYTYKLKVSVNANPLVFAEDTVVITRTS